MSLELLLSCFLQFAWAGCPGECCRLWRVGVLSAAVVGGEAVLIPREKESASGENGKENNSNRMCSPATPPSSVGWVKAKKHNLPVMHNLSLFLLLLVRT